MTELAKEVIKDWRRPAAVLLRLAILFRTFGPQRSDILPKHIEVALVSGEKFSDNVLIIKHQ